MFTCPLIPFGKGSAKFCFVQMPSVCIVYLLSLVVLAFAAGVVQANNNNIHGYDNAFTDSNCTTLIMPLKPFDEPSLILSTEMY